MPLVSVVIPTYNRKEYICIAIDSVLSQSFKNIEIIVIDDGSEDETHILLRKYSSKIKYIYIKHTGHPSIPRNIGIDLSHGDYIAFLDSDDLWLPEKLINQIEILKLDEDICLLCNNALMVKDNIKLDALYLKSYQKIMNGYLLKNLIKDNFVITSTSIIKKLILLKSGLFSEDENLRRNQDYDLWIRIAAISKIYYSPKPAAIYRVHANRISAAQSTIDYWKRTLFILNRLEIYLKNNLDEDIYLAIIDKKYICFVNLMQRYISKKQYSSSMMIGVSLIKLALYRIYKHKKTLLGL